jgi:hypothetical protein
MTAGRRRTPIALHGPSRGNGSKCTCAEPVRCNTFTPKRASSRLTALPTADVDRPNFRPAAAKLPDSTVATKATMPCNESYFASGRSGVHESGSSPRDCLGFGLARREVGARADGLATNVRRLCSARWAVVTRPSNPGSCCTASRRAEFQCAEASRRNRRIVARSPAWRWPGPLLHRLRQVLTSPRISQ